MRIDLPAWGAGELMFEARKKLFKVGWRQMDNYGDGTGRIDCIEKDFGNVTVGTIWAGVYLLLSPRPKGTKINSDHDYIPLTHSSIEEAKKELIPLFNEIVEKKKTRWNKEIKEYEKKHNIKFSRNPKYGV